MKSRSDLAVELDTTLDATGNFTGEWIDTTNLYQVTVLINIGAYGFHVDHSIDGVNVLASDQVANEASMRLYARYFRLSAVNVTSTPNIPFRASVRALS